MWHTLRSTLAVALVTLCVVPTMALATKEAVSGTVQNVDAQQGRMIFSSEEGKTMELRAPAELLEGLKNGDAVEVKLSGKQATFIRKQQEAQRPDIGGALRFPHPEGGLISH